MFLFQFFCSNSFYFLAALFVYKLVFHCLASIWIIFIVFMGFFTSVLRDFFSNFIFHNTDQLSTVSIFFTLLHSDKAKFFKIFFISIKALFVLMFSYSLIFHFLFCRNYHFKIVITIQILPLFLWYLFLTWHN